MQILTSLFGWVPEIIAEWGLYGILLAAVGLITEVSLLGALLMGAIAGVQFVLRYLGETHKAFSQKSAGRWNTLGVGLGVVVGVLLTFLVIGPSGIGSLAQEGFVWSDWVIVLVAGAVAALGFKICDHASAASPLRDLVGSTILGAGASVAVLHLIKGIIEVSQNSVVF